MNKINFGFINPPTHTNINFNDFYISLLASSNYFYECSSFNYPIIIIIITNAIAKPIPLPLSLTDYASITSSYRSCYSFANTVFASAHYYLSSRVKSLLIFDLSDREN